MSPPYDLDDFCIYCGFLVEDCQCEDEDIGFESDEDRYDEHELGRYEDDGVYPQGEE